MEYKISQRKKLELSGIHKEAEKLMYCTFKEINKNGDEKRCNEVLKKENIDKNNQNNNYCAIHQDFVNKINETRKLEAIKEYKEELMKLIQRRINKQEFWKDTRTALVDLKEEIYNFEFPINQKNEKDGEIIEL